MTSTDHRHKQFSETILKPAPNSAGFISLSNDDFQAQHSDNDSEPNSSHQIATDHNANVLAAQKELASFWERIFAVAFYCFSSILMTVANKIFRMASFKPLNSKNVCDWFHVTLLMIGMIYTSSKGLKYLPVANFTVCKNLLIIVMAWFDVNFFGGYVDRYMIFSFYLIILGSVIGGYSDMTFNLVGYIWLFLNCVFTASYLLEMRRCIKKIGFENFDTVYYNNTLAVPVLMILSACLDNWKLFVNSYHNGGAFVAQRSALYTIVLLSCFAAFFISYATCWCLRILSSTSYSIAGALNKLPIAVSGLVFFKAERNFSLGNLSSIALSFTGGLIYSIAQIRLRNREKASLDRPNDRPVPVAYKKVYPYGEDAGSAQNFKPEVNIKDIFLPQSSKINPHLLPIIDRHCQKIDALENKV